MIEALTLEDLSFAVRRSSRRRTIGIAIDRGGRLSVAVPARCSARTIETAVRAKLPWVRRKLGEMALAGGPPAPRVFVDGERFPYLGRMHRLRLVDAPAAPVALRRGRLELDRRLACDGHAQLEHWYTEHARVWLAGRMAAFAPRLGAAPTAIRVRDLGQRWGSCNAKGRVHLHWGLVLLPPRIADYVVVHELAHLRELNHSPRFWDLVEGVLPDYRERRAWLATRGHGYVF